MVPVLSTHSTSTRARVSMQFMSWTRTFCWASFMAETAMATLVSRYSPSGIMPMSAATVDVMPLATSRCSHKTSLTASTTPKGMTMMPTI